MAAEYDKIIKENIEAVILPLADKLFHIHPKHIEELPDDLQVTIERKPDFLKKIINQDGQEFILHIEFQSTNIPDMIYRMHEYRAMLSRRYKILVKQFVLYLGQKKPNMQTELTELNLSFKFHLENIQDYDYRSLVKSDIPEEILLAVLSDFQDEPPEHVIRLILKRLTIVSSDEVKLLKYLNQLRILSKLRKLQTETLNEIKQMPITYNIETDILFKKGLEKGRKEIILNLLNAGILTVEQIAEYTNAAVGYIKKIQAETQKK